MKKCCQHNFFNSQNFATKVHKKLLINKCVLSYSEVAIGFFPIS